MLIINQDTTSVEVKDWIQYMLAKSDLRVIVQFLNTNLLGCHNGELWDAVMRHEFNIYDGRTFFIRKQIQSNTLLHIAVYVQAKEEIIDYLLDIGMRHYAHLHTNSNGNTPAKFADELAKKYAIDPGNYVRLSSHIDDYIARYAGPSIDERVQDLFRNTDHPMINQRSDKEYVVTVDLLPFPNLEVYNLFNSSYTIHNEIQEFIHTTIRNYNRNAGSQSIQKDSIYLETEGSRVAVVADNENTLRILFGEEGEVSGGV